MSKLNEAKVIPRYMLVSVLMTLVSCCVLGKAFYIMTAEKDYWAEAAKQSARDSVKLEATRGNILSCDGRLMATTMPQYKIFMDFETLRSNPTDTAFADSLDAICQGLNEIFPEKPAEEFKAELKKGYAKRSRVWPVWKKRVDYDTWMEVSQLPVFRRGANKSGIHADKFTYRQHPFGSLAGRTIGDLYKEQYGGRVPRCGLEMAFDSVLRGKEGIGHSMMVRSKFLTITDVPPENGSDVVTTIDVNMQDLAERSVVDELKLIGGKVGVAIVMEVATGDIKAMVNMQHCDDGEYREIANHAVSDLLEPGSVFKTASIMAALDDGYVDTTYMVETGGGVWNMYGRDMKDHNWSRGGYGTLMLPWTLKYSSNIGVSRIIDKFYHDQPEKFVQKIHSFGRHGTDVEGSPGIQGGRHQLPAVLRGLLPGRQPTLLLHRLHTEGRTARLGWRHEWCGIPQHCRGHHVADPESEHGGRARLVVGAAAAGEGGRPPRSRLRAPQPGLRPHQRMEGILQVWRPGLGSRR